MTRWHYARLAIMMSCFPLYMQAFVATHALRVLPTECVHYGGNCCYSDSSWLESCDMQFPLFPLFGVLSHSWLHLKYIPLCPSASRYPYCLLCLLVFHRPRKGNTACLNLNRDFDWLIDLFSNWWMRMDKWRRLETQLTQIFKFYSTIIHTSWTCCFWTDPFKLYSNSFLIGWLVRLICQLYSFQ